jgi:ABC-type glycerol-3-phosphate transport system substrate-binding protein
LADPLSLLPAAGNPTPTPGKALPAATASTPPASGSTSSAQPELTASLQPPSQTDAITLTVWTIERLSPQAEAESGEMMAQGLNIFEETYPNIKVEIILKKPYGRGGILDFLRTSKDVAPTVSPDVVFIDIAELPQAWRSELIQPLDGLLDRVVAADLLPAARNIASVDGRLAGMPFELDLDHVVYNTGQTSAPPLLWTDILSSGVRYTFPAKSQNGQLNDTVLAQYLAVGAKLRDDENSPMIDESALRSILEFYAAAVAANVVDASVLEADQTDALWADYLSTKTGITHVSVHRYLTDRNLLSVSAVAQVPTRDGVPTNIGRGWGLAIVTPERARQVAALQFIEWITAPDRLVAWNQQVGYIPPRSTALDLIAGDDPYWIFVEEQLNYVQPRPAFSGYDLLARILHEAVATVIKGEATPEEAIGTAVGALNP